LLAAALKGDAQDKPNNEGSQHSSNVKNEGYNLLIGACHDNDGCIFFEGESMRKLVMALAVSVLLGSGSQVMAATLGADMSLMASNYAAAKKATAETDFLTSMQKMRDAAVDANKLLPDALAGKGADDAQVKDYHNGFTKLLGQIDQSVALAKQSKLDDAKKALDAIALTRGEYHKKFK
jgi:soluble cytochrome b562